VTDLLILFAALVLLFLIFCGVWGFLQWAGM
jgi:hypothetical protein